MRPRNSVLDKLSHIIPLRFGGSPYNYATAKAKFVRVVLRDTENYYKHEFDFERQKCDYILLAKNQVILGEKSDAFYFKVQHK